MANNYQPERKAEDEGGFVYRYMTQRELATVLAALRNWQMDELNEADYLHASPHFEEFTPLNAEEIDRLCERFNLEYTP